VAGLKSNLLDFEQQRLEKMDEWGTELSILSLNSPAVQGIPDAKRAIEVARRANDVLAEQVKRHPTRFGGFAALPMQDPEAAARELERCVKSWAFTASWSTASRRWATRTPSCTTTTRASTISGAPPPR
jgi:predicted TIM-barrel fold metal-dependent hydrolase